MAKNNFQRYPNVWPSGVLSSPPTTLSTASRRGNEHVIFHLIFVPQLYPLPLPSCPSYILFTKFHAPHGVEWGRRGNNFYLLAKSYPGPKVLAIGLPWQEAGFKLCAKMFDRLTGYCTPAGHEG